MHELRSDGFVWYVKKESNREGGIVFCVFFARLRKCPRGREESFCAAASQIAPGRTIVDLPT